MFASHLSKLERKNNKLKSKLRYFQIKTDTFKLMKARKGMDMIIKEYEKNNSLIISARNLGLDKSDVIKSYIEGQVGNPEYRDFYLKICELNGAQIGEEEYVPDYVIERKDNSWIYTVFRDGEKISIISSDYERLIEKIKNNNLPF